MSTAVVLLGHGSHISPNTAATVWEAVDALRALGIADEITAGFWKELPGFSRVLDTLTADDITLLPMFTAQGYFTRQVIPGEMPLAPRTRMARTLGEHPRIGEIIEQRARNALAQHGLTPSEVAVAVIGHGTKNNPTSRAATESQADRLRGLGIAAEVAAVYLDDDPEIPTVYESTSAPVIIAVPYFLAAGSHTVIDVPGALGLPDGVTDSQINGRRVVYTPPIGADGGLTDIVLALLADAGADVTPKPVGSVWDGVPSAGRDHFLAALRASGRLSFGALTVTPREVRCGDGDDLPTLTTPAQVRAAVRTEPFRPLVTVRDMPNRWRVAVKSPEQAHAVVETVYPGLIADWAAEQHGTLHVVNLPTVAARQKGMFRPLVNFSAADEAALCGEICAGCILSPRWARSGAAGGGLPCAEPCNVYLSAAKEGMTGDDDNG
ncbi:MAG: hypothetical protein MUF38_11145 [Anaerolineae bacterium]|jgi:sirohydrochlorin cobaltochelatase|nr:hypothetical protein [Anaerolineae bacterium]